MSVGRTHRKSDTNLQSRQSLDAVRALAHSRSSEQISRHPPLPHQDTLPRTPTLHGQRAPPAHDANSTPRPKSAPRFRLSRLRNASDSALGMKARVLNPPPTPTRNPEPPSIITTAPPTDGNAQPPSTPILSVPLTASLAPKRTGTLRLWRSKKDERPPSTSPSLSDSAYQRSSMSRIRPTGSSSVRSSRVTFDEPERSHNVTSSSLSTEPPPYDDNSGSLPLPGPRLSESSRSTASSGDQTIAYSTTTTTHTTTTTTFFRLPHRKRKEAPLFPLPSRTCEASPTSPHSDHDLTPTASSRRHSMVSMRSQPPRTPNKSQPDCGASRGISSLLAASSLNFAGPGASLFRSPSVASVHSGKSGAGTPPSRKSSAQRRGRSSTISSMEHPVGRTSGGSGFGGLFGRMRRDSELSVGGLVSRASSPQPHLALSTPTSGTVSHEISIPERNDEDTPPAYLSKLFEAISKSVVASLLARNDDPFHLAVLKVYMETFDFENDPMDMALRRLLMEVELPAEVQQIDRVLQAFAERYHDCNPFLYQDPDQAYYIAFSLIMLHTDFFNKNNKHKMQKPDYVKNTSRAIPKDGISNDILECFYSNITYTPFIRLEDEFDINGQKIVSHRPKKGLFHRTINVSDGKKIKEPVDPYLLIIEGQLDLLRASLKDVVPLDDLYSYTGTASRLDIGALHAAFFRSAVLQIVSARSRPDAFMTQQSMENPEGADPGVVEMKVTKVGLLWRKELKRKKTRSPWHEWGAVLTGSQLYFFRNITWVKSLMQQYEQHHKHGTGTPVIFKPALPDFKPDAQISTDDAVALLDKSYKKHKNAFAFIRHGGIQEYFIADSEAEMNDWLAKLNYAATFRTAGVRMRGVVGGNYDGQRARGIRRMESVAGSPNSHSIQTPTGEVSIVRGGIDLKLAAEIASRRREVVEQRIFDSEERIAIANRELQDHLRNGRHLTILTPVQTRTREQLVLAAGALAAKIQWVRMEMWKLRCHRDILALDMEEERKSSREQVKRVLAVNTPSVNQANRFSSLSSPSVSPVVDNGSGDHTPTQSTFAQSINDDLSRIMSHTSQKSMPSCGTSNESHVDRRGRDSVTSFSAPRSSTSSQKLRIDFYGRDDRSIDTSRRSYSPSRSQSSFGVEPDKEYDDDDDKENGKDKGKMKAKGKEFNRQHIRKSLQRTLRETQGLAGHRRGKSGDESTPDKKTLSSDEGLSRSTGSFTVHGKKASVITFGSEWQNILPDERLKRNRSGYGDLEPGEVESLSGISGNSRPTSLAVLFKKDDESEKGLSPYPSFSRRASYTNKEELPGVQESTSSAKIDDTVLIDRAHFVKNSEPNGVKEQFETEKEAFCA